MKIVYTYFNETDKTLSLGLAFFKQMTEVALYSSALQCSEIFIYTDKAGKKFLQKNISLPKNIVFELIDYAAYEFDRRFWNFPKLVTYSLQREDFLHIDLDIYLSKGFFDTIPQTDIVCERRRSFAHTEKLNRYNPRLWETGTEMLVCSGILGGSNLSAFQHQFTLASELCKPTKNNIEFDDLWGVEEYLLTAMANQFKYSVATVDASKFLHWNGDRKFNNYAHEVVKFHNRLLSNNYTSFDK